MSLVDSELASARSAPLTLSVAVSRHSPRARAAAGWLATVLVVLAAGAGYHRQDLLWPQPRIDEAIYLRAFDLVDAGRNPYLEPAFMYAPPFAVAGAAARAVLGDAFLPLSRLANLAGACLLACVALAGSAWGWLPRTAAALAAVCSPLVVDGLWCGSVSPLFLGLTTAGLALAAHGHRAGGALAGWITATKPVGVSALLLLPLPCPGGGQRRRLQAMLAAGVCGACWLLLGLRWLPSMLWRAGGFPEVRSNVSLPRVLYALGTPVHGAVPFVIVTLLGAALLLWRRPGPRGWLAVAPATTLLALPVNNPSTFILALPAQALALERAVGRWRRRRQPDGWRALAPLLLVAGAVASAHGAAGVAATGELSQPLQGLVTLIPLLAVAGTTVYASGAVER